jgi:hypothetical protein
LNSKFATLGSAAMSWEFDLLDISKIVCSNPS